MPLRALFLVVVVVVVVVVVCPQCSNISSETAWPIKAKFNVEPPWEGGMKVYINGPGHRSHDQDGCHYHIW